MMEALEALIMFGILLPVVIAVIVLGALGYVQVFGESPWPLVAIIFGLAILDELRKAGRRRHG